MAKIYQGLNMINSENKASGLSRFCFWFQALAVASPVFLPLMRLSFVILILFLLFFFLILQVLLVKRYIFFMLIICLCKPVSAVSLGYKVKEFMLLRFKRCQYCI